MLKSPPQEKRWLSWLYVVVWTLIIFVTIPQARTIQQYVSEKWSRDLFTYVVLALTVMGFVAAMDYVRRFRPASRSNYIWLSAVTGIFSGYTITLGQRSPEEAIHFVQYGVLGILAYRAWSHRLQDTSIYLQIDQKRAVEASKILNRFQDEYTYQTFLSLYTPITDPFIHEVRVHLFRRNRYYNSAFEFENDPAEYARRFTIALRENQILEKHFYNTLQNSDYVWTEKKLAKAQRHFSPDYFYDSWVSRDVITRVAEWQVASFFIALILGLVLFHWYIGKLPASETSRHR